MCFSHICSQLNVTDDSDLPQDMIAHYCQFRNFLSHSSGIIDKEQLDYQVFCMTVIYLSLLTPYGFIALHWVEKGQKCMFARA